MKFYKLGFVKNWWQSFQSPVIISLEEGFPLLSSELLNRKPEI
jgi:hypothetical protein